MKLSLLTARVVLSGVAVALLPLIAGCSAPPSMARTGDPRKDDVPSRIRMNNPGPHQIIVNAPALDADGNPVTTASGKPVRVRLHILVGAPVGTAAKSQYAVDREVSKDEPTNDGD